MPAHTCARAAAKGARGPGKANNPLADSALPSSLKDANIEFWPKVQTWVDAITKNEILGGLQNAQPREVVQGGRLATRCCEFRFERILN